MNSHAADAVLPSAGGTSGTCGAELNVRGAPVESVQVQVTRRPAVPVEENCDPTQYGRIDVALQAAGGVQDDIIVAGEADAPRPESSRPSLCRR